MEATYTGKDLRYLPHLEWYGTVRYFYKAALAALYHLSFRYLFRKDRDVTVPIRAITFIK
jgi:hypothetical protein